ncbi:MAG TPA: hypothetical protein VNU01_10600, partial [Egibacteraceae bacterium]|nr:hypothetical protein [Egibacteraceae bacterium]
DLLPGQERVSRISVRNTGNVRLDVRLFGSVPVTAEHDLAAHLEFEVHHVADGVAERVYPASGVATLRDFATDHAEYADGIDQWTASAGDLREYEFRVRLPEAGDPSLPGDFGPGWSATVTFTWEGRS